MGHTYEEIKEQFDKWVVQQHEYPYETLLEDHRIEYDARGAVTQKVRRIWRVKSNQVRDFGIVSASYAPWYQNQPTIIARVFDSNGREFQLGKDDLTVSPVGSVAQGVLTDQMMVQAALPGLKVGSIVEEVIEIVDREPFSEFGAMLRIATDTYEPTRFLSVDIDTPDSKPIDVQFLPQPPPELLHEQETSQGRKKERWFLNQRGQLDFKSIEPEASRNVFQQSSMIINTGKNWGSIAEWYAKIVDQRIEPGVLNEVVKEILGESTASSSDSIEVKATKLVNWLRQNIRYTGVLLGSAAIVPARSSTILGRRFGDCKDQSALLVGMLRASGIDANVALVNTDSMRFPMPSIPCANSFNHAIVVIRNPSGDFWIDPTDIGSTTNSIPEGLQGRYSLVASSDSTELTVIPSQGIAGNRNHTDQLFSIKVDGTASVTMEIFETGMFAAEKRNEASVYSQEDLEKQFNEYYAKSGSAIQLKITHRSDPQSDDPVFKTSMEMSGLRLEQIAPRRLRVNFDFAGAVDNCIYFHLVDTDEQGIQKPRKYPAECLVGFHWSKTTKIALPKGYRLTTKFQNHSIAIGIITLKAQYKELQDGAFELEQMMDVQPGVLSPDELEKLATLKTQLSDEKNPLYFNAIVEYGNAEGKSTNSTLVDNLNLSREQWKLNPNGETAYQYIVALVASAQVEEARDVALEIIRQYPEMGLAHTAYAFALMHDISGRDLGFGAEVRRAEQECRKAIELSADNWQSYYLLALLINVNDQRVHRNNHESATEQFAIFDEAEKRGVKNESLTVGKISVLFLLGRIDEAIQIASANGFDTYSIVGKLIKAAKASRWSDIAALGDRIQNQRERVVLGRWLNRY
jgi:tetratricopeptide (TPR) repeat protein